jgi:hypothetical protein
LQPVSSFPFFFFSRSLTFFFSFSFLSPRMPPVQTASVKKEVVSTLIPPARAARDLPCVSSPQGMSAGEKARAKKDKALLNKAKANPELAAAKKVRFRISYQMRL